MQKHITGIAVLAVLAVALAGIVSVTSDDSDAIGADLSGTYGAATNIDIAPGYRWTYTPDFPSDLLSYLTVSLKVNDSGIGSVSGKTVTVDIPSNASAGTRYNVVIQASMTSPVAQTAYQYVTFTVVPGLSVSGSINDIVKGSSISFTPTGSSGMGAVTWSIKSGTSLPAGLSLSNGVVSGTPTSVGQQTVSLTASAPGGETRDLSVTFTVYSKISGGPAQTIRSYNTSVSSDPVTNASDIGVTWAVTGGSLPSGFSLNTSTGVVSGKSSAVQSVTVTITGTSTHGPSQSATKQITIQSEPALTLSCGQSILTYIHNPAAVSATVTATASSAKTWSVSQFSGATVSDGVLSVTDSSASGMGQSVTVTCSTAYGQTVSVQVPVSVEAALSVSGDTHLDLLAGTEGSTSQFAVTGGSNNVLSASSGNAGLSVRIADGKLYASSTSPDKGISATVTVTSAAGQTASVTVGIDVYNQLVFTSAPTGGAIIYAV